MKRRPQTAAAQNELFLRELASLGLRSTMRPYLDPSNPSFVAALVLPPHAVERIYLDAANDLFAPHRNDPESDYDFTVVFIDNADGKDLARGYKMATILRRTLFFLTEQCDLPTEFGLAVDHYAIVPRPTADHFIATARTLGLGDVTQTDAEFLANAPPSQLSAAMTIGRPIASVVQRLRSVKGELPPVPSMPSDRPQPDMSLLDNLVGFSEVKAWGATLARDVAGWRDGVVPWSEVDRGAVIAGPPGTGKSRMAEALAAACGMYFLKTSAAKWQSMGHLGDFLKAMRQAFAEASKNAPCLLFLEELDSVGDRDADTSDNSQYTRKSVNGVLEAVDEAFAKQGVVIVGATNKIDAIDPALLRSGRIERTFFIGHPTASERIAILETHLKPHRLALPSPHFQLASEGMSGADLEKLAREAKGRARASGRAPLVEDVLACLPPIRRFSAEELFRVAVHEAGHALVGLKLSPHRLVGLHINDFHIPGRSQSIGNTAFERQAKTQRVPADYRVEVALLLGGIAAEMVLLGAFSDGAGGLQGSDLVVATDLVTTMECQFGFGGSLVSEVPDDARHFRRMRMQPEIALCIGRVLEEEFERATKVLENNIPELYHLVDALVEHKALSGEAAIEIIEAASKPSRRKKTHNKQAISAGGPR